MILRNALHLFSATTFYHGVTQNSQFVLFTLAGVYGRLIIRWQGFDSRLPKLKGRAEL